MACIQADVGREEIHVKHSHKWHVTQLYKLRKWKEPRAELREDLFPIRNRIRGHHMLRRLLSGIRNNPAVFGHGKRVSDPLIVIQEWPYRIRRAQGRQRQRCT